jgi:hypothetical protein
MSKKILLALATVVVVAGGVAALSAYEAHVINVTAHIENALDVHGEPIAFGTVFPQEYREAQVTVRLSDSFQAQDPVNAYDVDYEINQKLKPCPVHIKEPAHCEGEPVCYMLPQEECESMVGVCKWVPDVMEPDDPTCVADTANETPHNPTGWHYLNLCPFLSKMDDNDPDNDRGVSSYFQGTYCETPSPDYAVGKLILGNDPIDTWTVDLKVPPIEGYVGQDWPEGCPTIPANDKTYGCDLWVEVTGFSYLE